MENGYMVVRGYMENGMENDYMGHGYTEHGYTEHGYTEHGYMKNGRIHGTWAKQALEPIVL